MDQVSSIIVDLIKSVGGLPALVVFSVIFLAWSPIRSVYAVILRDGGIQRDELIYDLKAGGTPRVVYVRFMRVVLDGFDQFIGDRHLSRRGYSDPDWNGELFDVCARLGLVYPILSILITWIAFGDAGVLGSAIGLHPGTEYLTRLGFLLVLIAILVGAILVVSSQARRSRLLGISLVVGATLAGFASVGPVAMVIAICAVSIIYGFVFPEIVRNVAGSIARLTKIDLSQSASPAFGIVMMNTAMLTILLESIDNNISTSNILNILILVVIVLTGVSFIYLSELARKKHMLLACWCIFFPIAVTISVLSTYLHAEAGVSKVLMSAFPFVGLIALINIPFDWASIGLTRRLLRWSLEHRAPHPFLIAFVDFGLALLFLVGLGMATILALHAVNLAAVLGGAPEPIPLSQIFADLRADPATPAHAWVYFTLFSTILPSLLNFGIAIAALVAWPMPGRSLAAAIEQYVADPQGRSATLVWAPAALAGVWTIGFTLSALGFFGAAWVLFQIPGLGLGLLDAAEAFANATDPQR